MARGVIWGGGCPLKAERLCNVLGDVSGRGFKLEILDEATIQTIKNAGLVPDHGSISEVPYASTERCLSISEC